MRIGVLAVQGAFIEHEQILQRLNIELNKKIKIEAFEIRQKRDLEIPMDGLILPGGESTVMGKLLHELELLEPLKEKIENGLPVLATCAGLILLAEKIEGQEQTYFGTLPVTVRRNAYGRQLGSFRTTEELSGIGKIPMTFIRAPYVVSCGEGVEALAVVQGNTVAVKYQNQIGLSFHPEVTEDTRVHEAFLKLCQQHEMRA